MTKALEIVSAYKEAIGSGDFKAARRWVDDQLSFVGPFDTFDRPEPYFESLKKLSHIVKGADVHKVFGDGPDVCMLYDMHTSTPAGTAFIVEWYRVKGDKISSIRAVFDPRPFAAMFGK